MDTSYLISYLEFFNQKPPDEARIAKRQIDELKYKGCILKLSIFTVGEGFYKLTTDSRLSESRQHLSSRLLEMSTEGRIFDIYRPDMEELGNIKKVVDSIIRSGEYNTDAVDILILAHAIADLKCHGLLTFDYRMINSKGIAKVVREHTKGRKFIIADRE
ncbi:MAG: hypothetical protein QXI39_03250 [Candidatus Bathyarchaeia archaeon]